eukprot:g6477.t1
MCLYGKIAEKVAQATPFFHDKYDQHAWVLKHPLFHHHLFDQWASTMKAFVVSMEELESKITIIFDKLRDVYFVSNIQDSEVKFNKGGNYIYKDVGYIADAICDVFQQVIACNVERQIAQVHT